MTPQALNKLKELASEVDELRNNAVGLMMRLLDIYLDEEDVVENLGAHDRITKATVSLQKGVWQLGRAVTEIQEAHEFEKAQMDFLEGVKNKLHNYDTARTEQD